MYGEMNGEAGEVRALFGRELSAGARVKNDCDIEVKSHTRMTASWTISRHIAHIARPFVVMYWPRKKRFPSLSGDGERGNALNDDAHLSDSKEDNAISVVPSAICIDSSFACNLLRSYYAPFPRCYSHPSYVVVQRDPFL